MLSIRNPLAPFGFTGRKLKAIKKAWSGSQLNGIVVKVSAQFDSISLETIFRRRKHGGFPLAPAQLITRLAFRARLRYRVWKSETATF